MSGVQLGVHVSQPLIVDQPATDSFDDVVLVLVVNHSFLGVFTLGAHLRDTFLEPIAGSARRVVFRASLQLDVYVCDCVRYFRSEIGISGLKVDFDCIGYANLEIQSGLIELCESQALTFVLAHRGRFRKIAGRDAVQ